MTVQELITLLQEYPLSATIKFATLSGVEPEILSIYSSEDKKTVFIDMTPDWD
jgi:hypothetical protein